MRLKRAPASTSPTRDAYLDLKTRVQNKLLAEMDPSMDVSKTDEVRATIEGLYDTVLAEENIILSRVERQRLFEQIVAEILGFGPIEPFLADETITEVMVNGPKNIYIERGGKIVRTTAQFESNDHVMRIIDRMVAPLGRLIDEAQPYVDARAAVPAERVKDPAAPAHHDRTVCHGDAVCGQHVAAGGQVEAG
ncbi:MAG: Flp pilus assembly complex ATPase component TadA [Chloroflexi bacterium]|nr:Flp pilus assembly complex ATPase component TadA [Chloroflexota bacterium]